MTTQLPKDRAPSIRDVARLAGVSYQTVSRVLNHHPSIRETTKARVTAVMEEIQYRPNRAARMLVTRHSRTIGVLSAASAEYGPARSIVAIEDAARAAGYYVNIANLASADPESISEALEHLMGQAIEGLVVIAPQVRVFDVLARMSIDVPYVSFQATGGAELLVPADQVAGARMATRHLIDLATARSSTSRARRTGSRPRPGCAGSWRRSTTRNSTRTPRSWVTGARSSATSRAASSCELGISLPCSPRATIWRSDLCTPSGIKAAGFKGDVQYAGASTTVKDQQDQISAMVTNGAKVIIIGAADGGQLSTHVKAAHDAGAIVIAYDRLILNTADVDNYVAYDNFKVGKLQGQALLDGLKAKKATGPYNIELFSGSSDDANSKVFFDGAMSVLKPKIADGTLVVGSGQTDIKQTATAPWKAENAQSRMDALLTSTYGSKSIDGVLSPNDTLARAILTSVKAAGKPIPVAGGQDSEPESVKSIMAGEQYSTINKDTRLLVAQAILMVKDLQAGKKAPANDTKSYNNGVKVVPAFLLPPVIVTKANAAAAYANDPVLSLLTK